MANSLLEWHRGCFYYKTLQLIYLFVFDKQGYSNFFHYLTISLDLHNPHRNGGATLWVGWFQDHPDLNIYNNLKIYIFLPFNFFLGSP